MKEPEKEQQDNAGEQEELVKNKPENKNEKLIKSTEEFEKEIKTLTEKLSKTTSELDEVKNKAKQILDTASYYKNELDGAKKDFERYKERNKSFEKEASAKANIAVAKKLLPILDNFDQAVSHLESDAMKGFVMIHSSLRQVIADLGIVEIETQNTAFNPELHNCITTEVASDESQDGLIASVFQKGYIVDGTNEIVRPATVSIYKFS